MFGFFGASGAKKGAKTRVSANTQEKCVHFHREPSLHPTKIFVEVRDMGDHTIYISNQGITPSFLNTPYDDWCRSHLTESYVFASRDSAMHYFEKRPNELSRHLMQAIAEQVQL